MWIKCFGEWFNLATACVLHPVHLKKDDPTLYDIRAIFPVIGERTIGIAYPRLGFTQEEADGLIVEMVEKMSPKQ